MNSASVVSVLNCKLPTFCINIQELKLYLHTYWKHTHNYTLELFLAVATPVFVGQMRPAVHLRQSAAIPIIPRKG
jgi:hypothetical protein